MKKMRNLAFMLLASVFVFASCGKQKADDVSIKLSKAAITLTKEGGNEKVTFETDASEVTAYVIKGEEWLSVKAAEGVLGLNATANTTGEERTATVHVMAPGSVPAVLKVTQSAADFKLDLADGAIYVPTAGGTVTVDAHSNSSHWTLEALPESVTWLTVSGSGKGDIISITAKPNQSHETREVELYAVSSTGAKAAISVVQPGKAKYLLPYFTTDFKLSQLVQFEVARGSVVRALEDPAEFFGQSYPGQYLFLTPSDVQPEMLYQLKALGDKTFSKITSPIVSDNPEVELKEYGELLVANGFVKDEAGSSATLHVYKHPKLSQEASLELTAGEGILISFLYKPAQPKPYPTWSKVPGQDFIPFLDDATKKVADIDAFEASLGTTVVPEFVIPNKQDPTLLDMKGYKTGKTGAQDEHLRLWIFWAPGDSGYTEALKQSPSQVTNLYDNLNLVFYNLDGGTTYYETQEFKKLMADNEFFFLQENQGALYYAKKVEGQVHQIFVVRKVNFTDVKDGADQLQLILLKRELKTSGAMKTLFKNLRNKKYNAADLLANRYEFSLKSDKLLK